MLRSLKELEGYTLSASDGDIGKVKDFLLDDERWTIRYLVADTGGFLMGRRVLISPIAFRRAEWSARRFHLALTMDKIKNSPSIDVDQPVSRQHELEYYRYYGYPFYWGSTGIWGAEAYPGALAVGAWSEEPARSDEASGDAHLRSAREVTGYGVQGSDAAIGHVADFIVDDETWEVRYLVVDTSNWGFGKKVLVAPDWATDVSWAEREVQVDLSRQAIRNSPEWDAGAAIDREYEARLHDHYGRSPYWGRGVRPEAALHSSPPPSHPSL